MTEAFHVSDSEIITYTWINVPVESAGGPIPMPGGIFETGVLELRVAGRVFHNAEYTNAGHGWTDAETGLPVLLYLPPWREMP